MTVLLKDPDASLDYLIDWGAEYLGEDSLAGSSWSVSPQESGGIGIIGSSFDAARSTVQAAGGIPGRIYRLVNQVHLASGRVDSRSVTLRVERR